MTFIIPADQKELHSFVNRRHPEYDSNVAHWNFVSATYKGGREWFVENIHKYYKEGDAEYTSRKERCYRFNHTRETIDLIQKYIFKSKISRSEDAPEEIKRLWDNTTLSNLDIEQFMRIVSTESSTFGLVWIFMDTNVSTEVVSRKDAAELKARIYAYLKNPIDVLDFSIDQDGEMGWILVREYHRDDADPFGSSGGVSVRYRLWGRTQYAVFEEIPQADGKESVVKLIEFDENKFGFVPVIPASHIVGEYKYKAPGLVDDIAYQDKAVANYLSNLDAIIQDQTFSQLAIPAQALKAEDSGHDKVIEMGTKRIFTYDAEGGEPKYLSPDVKQAGVILQVINKIISEIYHTIGMAGERTKQDNAVGIDNSSGVAKAYDFERVNALLASKAQSLENAENKMIDFAMKMNQLPAVKTELVKYPQTFDVRSLFDEFTIAEKMTVISAPDLVRREQMRQVIDKLFPYLGELKRNEMEAELTSWPPKQELATNPSPVAFGKAKPTPEKRQGQVTAKSK